MHARDGGAVVLVGLLEWELAIVTKRRLAFERERDAAKSAIEKLRSCESMGHVKVATLLGEAKAVAGAR